MQNSLVTYFSEEFQPKEDIGAVLSQNHARFDKIPQSPDLHETFTQIKQWRNQKIYTSSKLSDNLIKDISHINFPNLKTIFIPKSKIASIEGFHRICFPVLQALFIHENEISSIRDLRKGYFSKLENLQFHNNMIMDKESLARLWAMKITDFSVELLENEKPQRSDIRWTVKIQNESFEFMWIFSRQRINSNSIQQAIKRRFHIGSVY